jgi:hypothetical protein
VSVLVLDMVSLSSCLAVTFVTPGCDVRNAWL